MKPAHFVCLVIALLLASPVEAKRKSRRAPKAPVATVEPSAAPREQLAQDEPAQDEPAKDERVTEEAAKGESAKGEGTERCRMAVFDVEAQGYVKEEEYIARVMSEAIAAEFEESSGCEVITQGDIRSMIDFEAEKASLGCEEGASPSCLAEIGGALGVQQLMTGTVAKLGESSAVNLKLLDIHSARVLRRVEFTVENEPVKLRQAAIDGARQILGKDAVAEASGAEGPSLALAVSGGALLAVGGVGGLGTGVLALLSEGTLQNASETQANKTSARELGAWMLGAAAAGVATAAIGGVILGAAFME